MTPRASKKKYEVGPLRIAVVLSGLGAGGAERVASIISREWVELGHQVTVIAFDPNDLPSYYSFDPRVAVRRLGLPPSRVRLLAAVASVLRRVRALKQVLRETSPDVVVSFLTRTNVLTLLSSWGIGSPVVVSERNNPNMQNPGFVWNLLRNATYRHAFGLVTMTRGALHYFPQSMRAHGWVIPNPVIIPRDLPRKQLDRSHSGKTLTAVGRLVDQKGFDLLLQAFANIAPAFPDWKLVIWGEGPERASLERQRDVLGLNDRVLMPGVSKSPGAWIETADAFVFSSRYEGWGNVVLEAMSAGVPVVSFDCPWGPSEMIEHGVDGLLVPREDVTALARALASVMEDEALRGRLGAAAAVAVKRYTPDKIIAAWNEVLIAAVKSRTSSKDSVQNGVQV